MSGMPDPAILVGLDGEPPVYVNAAVAATEADAVAYAKRSSELPGDVDPTRVAAVFMRELDPIACKIRGVDHPWWVECTLRAKRPVAFFRIDE